jgi:hypothetical protein
MKYEVKVVFNAEVEAMLNGESEYYDLGTSKFKTRGVLKDGTVYISETQAEWLLKRVACE